MKLEKSECDNTQKLKFLLKKKIFNLNFDNSKTQNVTQLKNSNCDKT